MIGWLRRQRWWMVRVAMLPVHLLSFAAFVFVLVRLMPGDPVIRLTGGQNVSAEMLDQARESLGLADSLPVQFVRNLGNLVTFNFGNSLLTGLPVADEIARRLSQTLEIAVLAMVGAALLTLAAGFLVVLRPSNVVSRVVRVYARTAGAVPDFVLGVGGIFLFYTVLRVVPAPTGRFDASLNAPTRVTGFPLLDALLTGDMLVFGSMLAHLALPVLVLVVAYTPIVLKIFIRALDDAVDAPSTRFRIASGGSRKAVYLSIARRALPPTVTMFGTLFGLMLGGIVVIEQLFSQPGMGALGVDAVNNTDIVSLQGFLLVVAALSLLVFLLVDIVNMLLDPRRRPGGSEKTA